MTYKEILTTFIGSTGCLSNNHGLFIFTMDDPNSDPPPEDNILNMQVKEKAINTTKLVSIEHDYVVFDTIIKNAVTGIKVESPFNSPFSKEKKYFEEDTRTQYDRKFIQFNQLVVNMVKMVNRS